LALADSGGGGGGGDAAVRAALARLAAGVRAAAVVTLGERGCLVAPGVGGVGVGVGGVGVLEERAVAGIRVVDTTGAGDMFAAGFLYGMLSGASLQRCAAIGCLAGAAAVRASGAELQPADWSWLHSRLHGSDLAAAVVRESAAVVHAELLAAYALVARLGRGVVLYGSARLQRDDAAGNWAAAHALGAGVSRLLGVTTWSGGGPGLMQAATEGAAAAGGRVGGIRIAREAGTKVLSAGYLPAESQVVCRILAARKVALVDAGVRASEADRTAYIFLPGGLGTMDELFELLTLAQARRRRPRAAQGGGGGGGGAPTWAAALRAGGGRPPTPSCRSPPSLTLPTPPFLRLLPTPHSRRSWASWARPRRCPSSC